MENNGPMRWIEGYIEFSPRVYWFKLTCGHIVQRTISNFSERYCEVHRARCHICKRFSVVSVRNLGI